MNKSELIILKQLKEIDELKEENMKLKDKVEGLQDKIDSAINNIEKVLNIYEEVKDKELITNAVISIECYKELYNLLKEW